jgi:hypothetical protein
MAAFWKASAPGQLPFEAKPGKDFSLDTIANDEAAGFGNLNCGDALQLCASGINDLLWPSQCRGDRSHCAWPKCALIQVNGC